MAQPFSDALRGAANEFETLFPAQAQPQQAASAADVAIQRGLNALMAEVAAMRVDLRGDIAGLAAQTQGLAAQTQGLNTRMDDLNTRMSAMDQNNTARLHNSVAVTPEFRLSPLYNLTTGILIAECPETLADLADLPRITSARILQELNIQAPRGRDESRKTVSRAFGVRLALTL
ncbi:hypothetical protein N7495_008150 [Penicillium taxi]|uniref:uncharacterized protein n=1 Tax=Penicillium taxi TaxID=168475 RepID=UPI002544E4C1|nr:uncharacterized protein N7495_008150 [Penicillium taxi]KAJ5888109.1 hypothetical protein N7495_008150 [Penicillium taxi]